MSASMETGFGDLLGARAVVRRMKLRRQLLAAQASLDACLDLLDKNIETNRLAVDACLHQLQRSLAGNGESAGDNFGFVRVESDHEREKELLEGVQLILELLDRLHGGMGQGLFSKHVKPKLSQHPTPPHRLSGAAK